MRAGLSELRAHCTEREGEGQGVRSGWGGGSSSAWAGQAVGEGSLEGAELLGGCGAPGLPPLRAAPPLVGLCSPVTQPPLLRSPLVPHHQTCSRRSSYWRPASSTLTRASPPSSSRLPQPLLCSASLPASRNPTSSVSQLEIPSTG